MSDTPRTDAAAFSPGTGNQWEELVDADFARQLERELNAEQSRVSSIGAQLIGLEEKIDAVTRELAEARRDAEMWHAVRKSTMILWDGVEMQDAVAAWENEYRARLARGVTTDAEVKAHHAAMAGDPPAAEKG